LNIDSKISLLPISRYKVKLSVSVHLRYSNKQQPIPTKFYINSAPFIGSYSARFQLNLSKQTIAIRRLKVLEGVFSDWIFRSAREC